jgi:hypothetical protein
MNIQNLMQQAQKMQKDLQKTQKVLENSEYEGVSSFVRVVLNGNKEMKLIKINLEENSLEKEDFEMLEDMIMLAYNDASKKVDDDKEKKLGKYGSGLSGLM